MAARLHVIGVRHHSPACARLVADTVATLKPRYVLIEGPADMNGRIGELSMQRRLPFAIYSYLSSPLGTSGSWTPFCDYSPEWVAIKAARRRRAHIHFIDLPAWSKVFLSVRNRYADRRLGDTLAALCERFGVDDSDSLWDHLFEQPTEAAELAERLHRYFEAMREAEPAEERDRVREGFMAQWIAWAMEQCPDNRCVLVVCGGYHAPYLESAWRECDPVQPELPEPAGEDIRWGSYLVPYTFHRLDSFTGYQAGMPSPAWYQAVWELGPEAAPARLLERVATRLRRKKQVVSAADLIASWSLACGLQKLRGHGAIARVDLLDGLAGALIKEALDQPVPWSRRGVLAPGTAPVLVEVVAAFSGDRKGRLVKGTPLPPLVHEVTWCLREHDLVPPETGSRAVELDLSAPDGLERSRVLHRLRVLEIPGFTRQHGPRHAVDGELSELWVLEQLLEADAALIEAGAYGATLAGAAAARLEERLLGVRDRLAELVQILGDAVFTGVDQLADRVLGDVAQAAGAEARLEVVGEALSLLLALWRHDDLMGAAGAEALSTVIGAAYDRGLWLYESIDGPSSPADRGWIAAVSSLRDTLRFAGADLALDSEASFGVMRRCSKRPEAPPALRGAGLGFLWSMGAWDDPKIAERSAREALARAGRPDSLGDFLAGLFALAREEVMHAPGLLVSIDSQICDMDTSNFLEAMPSLRLAFSYFPPREKERIARLVFSRLGENTEDLRTALKLAASPEIIAAGIDLNERVIAVANRYGLSSDESIR